MHSNKNLNLKSESDSSRKQSAIINNVSPESVVFITHEQNIIHIISRPFFSRQLFASHEVGSRPMKRRDQMHRMIINNETPGPRGRRV